MPRFRASRSKEQGIRHVGELGGSTVLPSKREPV